MRDVQRAVGQVGVADQRKAVGADHDGAVEAHVASGIDRRHGIRRRTGDV